MSVLFVADPDNAQLKAATLSPIDAAAELGDVTVLVTGHNCQAGAE